MTKERIKKLVQRLATEKLDGILITSPGNRRYLSGFSGSDGMLLITPGANILATDFRYYEQVQHEAPEFNLFKTRGPLKEWFAGLIHEAGTSALGIESKFISVSIFHTMEKALTDAGAKTSLVPVENMVEPLRLIKDSSETDLIKKAAELSDDVIFNLEQIARPGITELELAWKIEQHMRQSGSQPLGFEVICASGSNSALPHAKPTTKVIQKGEPVVLDFGARFAGYTSDITRTICFGEPDSQFKKLYNIVFSAQKAAVEGICSGMNAVDADSLARKVIENAGYGQFFGHGLGHGIGLDVHEGPALGPLSKDTLADGMIFTIEPGIYIPGWGGVRIEDNGLLANGKLHILTSACKLDLF